MQVYIVLENMPNHLDGMEIIAVFNNRRKAEEMVQSKKANIDTDKDIYWEIKPMELTE